MNNMPREPGAPYGLPAVSAVDRALTRNLGPLGPGGFNASLDGCAFALSAALTLCVWTGDAVKIHSRFGVSR